MAIKLSVSISYGTKMCVCVLFNNFRKLESFLEKHIVTQQMVLVFFFALMHTHITHTNKREPNKKTISRILQQRKSGHSSGSKSNSGHFGLFKMNTLTTSTIQCTHCIHIYMERFTHFHLMKIQFFTKACRVHEMLFVGFIWTHFTKIV